MRPAAELLAEGRAAAPALGRSAFCAAHGVRSEAEYKRRRRDEGRIMFHAHLGLSDWPATAIALDEIVAGLGELDRFGLCLSRSMSLPAERRAGAAKETGPRLEPGDWDAVAAAPAQAHLGDFMIGTPAGLENTVQALAAGITTIGNLGQHFAFEPPGGHDDADLTETTVRALGAMSARGALVHSYLDDDREPGRCRESQAPDAVPDTSSGGGAGARRRARRRSAAVAATRRGRQAPSARCSRTPTPTTPCSARARTAGHRTTEASEPAAAPPFRSPALLLRSQLRVARAVTRPAVCRGYSCAGDKRIWSDFEAIGWSQEWIDAHLGGDELQPDRDGHLRLYGVARINAAPGALTHT